MTGTQETNAAAATGDHSRIVDCHVHALPQPLLNAIASAPVHGWSADRVEAGWRVQAPGAEPKLVRPPMVDTANRAGWADRQGITAQIVSPWLDAQPTPAMPAEAARDWAARINDTLLEQEAPAGNAVLATLALGDPRRAAGDLTQAVRDGFAGVVMSTHPAGAGLADPALDDVWAAAESLDAAVLLHPPTDGPSRVLSDGAEFGNTYGRLVDTTYAAARLLLSGVLDRHPRLRLVLVHGGGFLPYQSLRLDGGHRADGLAGYHIDRDHPSDYLRDLYFDTVAMSAPAVGFLAATVGAGHVLLGSDHPFPLGDRTPPATVRAAGLDAAATDAVLGGNATTVFGLPTRKATHV
jgi:aminocarboxymuconate-semialdehyde decarboxylase